ncbi:MAG: hypothetical protein IJ716_09670 [Lachnospiraceae bacterium]|nr:hypothetical protein [Lachnospiraceae bacterium]
MTIKGQDREHQPAVYPPNRQGKAKSPVEFGAKLDMSIDEKGLARLEKLSFDAYNECDVLIDVVERYHARTGRYPEKVLADQMDIQDAEKQGVL